MALLEVMDERVHEYNDLMAGAFIKSKGSSSIGGSPR